MSLKLAQNLVLPDEAALQRFGILAMSGAGKSNTAVVMAEEMYAAGIPWVAVDPKGDWWGIRSSRSGRGPGLEVPIFGGLHGDLPLEETAGKMMAELIADTRLTCVLDVSEFPSKAAQLRFLTDFAETLLKKNKEPLHIFAEEADDYLPQRVMKSEARCVGAWTKLVKRGRFRGIFVSLISQRSAALSKDALGQVDTLMPMRTPAPRDKKAIEEWVIQHDFGRELVDSLPSLADGEVWVWSPHRLKLKERHHLRRRHTFDSGETPTLKGGRPAAKLADVDLEVVKERMAETIERAEADDPKKLRARVAELQRQLRNQPETEPEEVEVKVPVFPPTLRTRLTRLVHAVIKNADDQIAAANSLRDSAVNTLGKLQEENPFGVEIENLPPASGDRKSQRASRPAVSNSGDDRKSPSPPPGPNSSDLEELKDLPKAARKMLEVLIQRAPARLTRSQLATLSGYSAKSSTIPNSLSALRTSGYLDEEQGLLYPSEAAFDEFGQPPAPPTPEELRAQWRLALPGGAAVAFFDALAEVYPDGLMREDLAARTGYSIGSSTIPNALSTLRRNGLLREIAGAIFLKDELFE